MNPTIPIGQLIQSQYQYESNVYLTNCLISKHCLILVNCFRPVDLSCLFYGELLTLTLYID